MIVKILTVLSWTCALASIALFAKGMMDESGCVLLMAVYIDGRLYLYK